MMNDRVSHQTEIESICLLGFGEVGQTLATDLAEVDPTSYDILFGDDDSAASRALVSTAVQKCDTPVEAVEKSGRIISAVTAAEDIYAAESVAGALLEGSYFLEGIESLLSESMLVARHYHVEDDVLDSPRDLFPGIDWPELARYMMSRSIEHGIRRAEEMREVVATVADAGLVPLMSEACAKRQDRASSFKDDTRHETLSAMLDAMLGSARKSDQPS